MLYSQFKLKDLRIRLKNLSKSIKKNEIEENVERYKPKFYGLCLDMKLVTIELMYLTNNSFYHNLRYTIKDMLDKVKNDSINGSKFKDCIDTIVNFIGDEYNYDDLKISMLERDVKMAITSKEMIRDENIDPILYKINTNNKHTINALEPQCYNGKTLSRVKKCLPDSTTYGIEYDECYFKEAKKCIDRMARGSLKGSKISNNTFDIMLLQLPITWAVNNIKFFTNREEKNMLLETIKYLKTDGVSIIYLPYFRLHQDICTFLAKNFKNIQIRKTCGGQFDKRKNIIIIGQKKKDKELIVEEYNKLRTLDIDKVKMIYEPIDEIILPAANTTIDFFRGSVLDFEEMDDLIKETQCYEDFWNQQSSNNNSKNTKQPLLPFNIGQIGLVLTSGCLDGIIKEDDKNYHLIKGRVSKKSEVEREITNGKLEVKETISNKVEIKVILPNGEFKTLA